MAKVETKIIEIKIQGLDGFNEIAKHVDQIEIAEKEIKKLKYETDELGKSVKRSMTTQDKNRVAEYTTTIKMHRKEIGVLSKEVISSFKADQQKLGYVEKLEAEVQSLTLQYRKLTEAQLNDVNVGGKMLVNLKKKREELQGMKQAYGDYGMAVGNYGTATKMLGINIGQVMKEMPNFAISARTGIMSLTNNLPMLGEAIQYVRIEQQKLIAAGKQAPSMFSLISKSVFGLTGILSIGMVLMQIYGADMIKFIGNLFNAGKALDETKLKQEALNDIIKNGSTEIKNAYQSVREVEIAFQQYKVGILTSTKALGIFNKELGDQLGKQTDINEAMRIYTEKADAYMELQWKQALISEYQKKAAEAYIKLNDKKQKSDKDYAAWYEVFYGLEVAFGKSREEVADTMLSERTRKNKKAQTDAQKELAQWSIMQKKAMDDAVKFATENGLQILNLGKDAKKVTETMLRSFDYESKIMEERAKALEVGRERELSAVDADYNAKLVRSQQHIDKLKQQEKAGVKGAKEARIQSEKQQEAYELALEEGKGRKKIEIGLKYDKLQADNALAELKHQHDMMIAENELSAKEQYDATVKYADDEYNAKIAQLSLMNISEEEYLIKSTEAWNQRQLAIANGEKKLTKDLYNENQARLNNELAALTTGRDVVFQNLDEIAKKQAEALEAKRIKEVEDAGNNGELIKSIEAKYAAESVALEDWKTTSKIDKYKFWADTALNVGSEVNKAIGAFAEHELSVWAKANEGKANFDAEYEKKKIDLQRKAAIREKALGVFSATINTAASIIKMLADPGGLAGILLSVGAGITGAAQIATILATPLPSMSSSSSSRSPKVEKTTVTEKFHTGGTNTAQTGVETPATLLGGESVNTIATTQMFSPLLSALNQLGGGKAITSGVANTGLGTDMLASAFSKALRNMPAPILIMEEFEKASEKHKKIQNNRIIK